MSETPTIIQADTDAAQTDPAEALLQEAIRIVTGARRQAYGTPEDNFRCIADLWTAFLAKRMKSLGLTMGYHVTAHDVASMMILMKAARLAESPDHRDSAVDIAGYAGCLARIQVRAVEQVRHAPTCELFHGDGSACDCGADAANAKAAGAKVTP